MVTMASEEQNSGGAYQYVTLSDEVTQDYIKMFKEVELLYLSKR